MSKSSSARFNMLSSALATLFSQSICEASGASSMRQEFSTLAKERKGDRFDSGLHSRQPYVGFCGGKRVIDCAVVARDSAVFGLLVGTGSEELALHFGANIS